MKKLLLLCLMANPAFAGKVEYVSIKYDNIGTKQQKINVAASQSPCMTVNLFEHCVSKARLDSYLKVIADREAKAKLAKIKKPINVVSTSKPVKKKA